MDVAFAGSLLRMRLCGNALPPKQRFSGRSNFLTNDDETRFHSLLSGMHPRCARPRWPWPRRPCCGRNHTTICSETRKIDEHPPQNLGSKPLTLCCFLDVYRTSHVRPCSSMLLSGSPSYYEISDSFDLPSFFQLHDLDRYDVADPAASRENT